MYEKEIEALESIKPDTTGPAGRMHAALDIAIALMRAASPKDAAAERERCRLLALGAQGFGPDTVAEVLELACAQARAEGAATERTYDADHMGVQTGAQLIVLWRATHKALQRSNDNVDRLARERDQARAECATGDKLLFDLRKDLAAARAWAETVQGQVGNMAAQVTSERDKLRTLETRLTALITAAERYMESDCDENCGRCAREFRAAVASAKGESAPGIQLATDAELRKVRAVQEAPSTRAIATEGAFADAHDRLRSLEAYTTNLRAAAEDFRALVIFNSAQRMLCLASDALRAALDAPMPAPTTERRETFDAGRVRELLYELREESWDRACILEAAAAVEASEVRT